MDFLIGLGVVLGLVVGGFLLIERVRAKRDFYGSRAQRMLKKQARVPPMIGVADCGAVFLETDIGNVLILLPTVPRAPVPQPTEDPLADAVDAVVVVNDPSLGGVLRSGRILQALGLDEELDDLALFRTAEGPLVRGDDVPLDEEPELLEEGILTNLTLTRLDERTLHAVWADPEGDWVARIGVELALVDEEVHYYVGAFGALDEAATKAWLGSAHVGKLHAAMLVRHAGVGPSGPTTETWARFFQHEAIGLQIIGDELWAQEAAEVVRELRDGNHARADELLAKLDVATIEQALFSLAASGDDEVASELVTRALRQHPKAGALHFQRGVLASMRGDDEEALAALREALAVPTPYPHASINLAALLAEAGDLEAAKMAALDALEALPEDGFAVITAVLAHARLESWDEAAELLEAHGDALVPASRATLGQMIDEREVPPKEVRSFPMHAALMRDLGEAEVDAQRWPEAIAAFRRAIELAPLDLGAVGGLGHALSASGDDEAALAHYDAAIDEVPGGALLRFNRANVFIRLERYTDAIADLEVCVDLLPDWMDAKVNLLAACIEAGEKARAEEILEQLENDPAMDPDLCDLLAEQFLARFGG